MMIDLLPSAWDYGDDGLTMALPAIEWMCWGSGGMLGLLLVAVVCSVLEEETLGYLRMYC